MDIAAQSGESLYCYYMCLYIMSIVLIGNVDMVCIITPWLCNGMFW